MEVALCVRHLAHQGRGEQGLTKRGILLLSSSESGNRGQRSCGVHRSGAGILGRDQAAELECGELHADGIQLRALDLDRTEADDAQQAGLELAVDGDVVGTSWKSRQ